MIVVNIRLNTYRVLTSWLPVNLSILIPWSMCRCYSLYNTFCTSTTRIWRRSVRSWFFGVDFNTPNSTTSYLTTLQQFDASHSFGEQGQSSSAARTNIENTNIEQQYHRDVGESIILERRNLRRNQRPPPCGTGHHLGHWSIKCCDNEIKYV